MSERTPSEISEVLGLAEELGKWQERKAEAIRQIQYLQDRLNRCSTFANDDEDDATEPSEIKP